MKQTWFHEAINYASLNNTIIHLTQNWPLKPRRPHLPSALQRDDVPLVPAPHEAPPGRLPPPARGPRGPLAVLQPEEAGQPDLPFGRQLGGHFTLEHGCLTVSVSVFRANVMTIIIEISANDLVTPENRPMSLFLFLLLLSIISFRKNVIMSPMSFISRPTRRAANPGQITQWLRVIIISSQWLHFSPSGLFW